MTRDRHDVVRLSHKDWAGLVTAMVVLLGTMFGLYQAHDRVLTEIVVRQEYIQAEQSDIKEDMDQIQTQIEDLKYANNSTFNQ